MDSLPQWRTPPTDEEVAKALARRAEVERLLEVRARLSPEEKDLAFAIRVEATARAQIELLESEGQPADLQRQTLAQALMDQGRLEEVAEVWPGMGGDAARGMAAIERPDEEFCECGREYWFVKKRVFTVKRGWLYLMKCSKCGELNARVGAVDGP
jgi:hypothetical protein